VTAGPRWRLAEPRHGSLPVLLLALTLVTGVIDAISLLALGRVFVANMTGNVVVTGFALAGVPEFSLVTSLVVLAAFIVGAAAGGQLIQRIWASRRTRSCGAGRTGRADGVEGLLSARSSRPRSPGLPRR
jgi:hypothetical protein